MERWAPQLIQLEARDHFNMKLNSSAVRESPWTQSNGTKAIIKNLQLQQVQTLRTMHLTIGVFSLVVVLLTVYRIISDARRAAAAQYSVTSSRFGFLRSIHPAETFPLVLACGAVLQQLTFVAVQSTSLNAILSRRCRWIAMVTFPAIFYLGYITLVFGIEMAVRAYRRERFSPRGKWNAGLCIAIVGFLVLMTWVPTVAWPTPNICFGSLIWFPVRYELIAIIILAILVFSFLLLAALISIQLMRTSDVDPNERIAASRMCYYLLMAALIYALVLPLEIQAHRRNFMNALVTSRIAEVSLFTSGILIGFFHLFLRANANRMVISPIKGGSPHPSTKKRRPRIRFFGPSDLEMNISGPLALQGGRRPDSRQGLIELGLEKERHELEAPYIPRPEKPLSPGSMKSLTPVDPTKWPLPPDPVPVAKYNETKALPAPGVHKRNKSSYSLFPTRAEDVPRLPATVYSPPKPSRESRISKLALRRQTRRSSLGDAKSVTDINEAFNFLSKPPPLFSGRHRREQSTDSSATVQIGLRFSVAPATLAAAKCTAANRQVNDGTPPLRREGSDSTADTLGLPIQAPSTNTSNSTTPSNEDLDKLAFPWPPQSTASPPKPPTQPPLPVLNSSAYLQSRGKVLPPTPRSAGPGAPPSQPPPRPPPPMSGLRMNPVSPSPSTSSSPATTPRSATSRTRSPIVPSPTGRLPLGTGTMSSSPPPNGWI